MPARAFWFSCEKEDLSVEAEPETLKVGGLGIHFMRTLMDDIQYTFDRQGNTLTMIKQMGDA